MQLEHEPLLWHVCPPQKCPQWPEVCCAVQDWPEDNDQTEVEFRYLCGNTDHSGALEEAGIMEADAIIIGPADDLPDNEVRRFLALSPMCTCPQQLITRPLSLQGAPRTHP